MDLGTIPHLVDVRPFQGYRCSAPTCVQPEPLVSATAAALGVCDVLQAGDPLLNTPVPEVPLSDIGSPRIERTINDMVAAMRNLGGSSLAAPQIGRALQIIVLEETRGLISSSFRTRESEQQRWFNLMVIINPKLNVVTPNQVEICTEDCLSVNGYSALVKRYSEVEVTGLGRRGETIHVRARGPMARVLQHEYDHLEGILYVDKMVARSFRRIVS